MPTGYTAGILDGSVEDFKQFAIQCMRAFGATLHMRDEPMDMVYEPRVPTNYHTEQIELANKLLKQAESLSDEEIVSMRTNELIETRSRHQKYISDAKENRKKLETILLDVKRFIPPTNEHTEIREFMIQQIVSTIDFDCTTDYYEGELIKVENEFKNIAAGNVRVSMKTKAYKDLVYHTEKHAEEVNRCNKANEWVEKFIASLSNSDQNVQVSDTTKASL